MFSKLLSRIFFEQSAGDADLFGYNWDISAAELLRSRPVKRARRNHPFVVIVFVALALVGTIVLKEVLASPNVRHHLTVLRASDYGRDDVQKLVVAFGVACLGVLLFGAGLAASVITFLIVKELTITETEVQFRAFLFGKMRNQWAEPLANYRGVSFKAIKIPGGKNSPPKQFVTLRMEHIEAHKRIRLYKIQVDYREDFEGGGSFRSTWEAYARALNLPTLEAIPGGGIIGRDAQDLDKPVGELVREKKIAPNWCRNAPPRGLHISEGTNDKLSVTFKLPRRVRVFCVVFLGAFVAIFAACRNVPAVCLGLAAAAIYTGVMWSMRKSLPVETRITIEPGRVVFEQLNREGAPIAYLTHSEYPDKADSVARLEEIRVYDGPVTRSGGVFVGSGLTLIHESTSKTSIPTPSRQIAEWLRGAILTLASREQDTSRERDQA